MAAIPSIAYPSMDLLHPDDTMDLASSPHPTDDLPLELDTMRDASVEPTQEAMLDDPIHLQQRSAEDLQLGDEDLLQDDDMLDEDTVIHNPETNVEDLPMEVHPQTQPDAEIEDDEILYDDEEIDEEPSTEDRNVQDLDIDNEEDLFHEEEAVQEHEMGEPADEQGETDDNQVEEVFLEEPYTNTTTQESETTEARQESGPMANVKAHSKDYNAEQLTQHEDGLHHEFDNEDQTDTHPAGESGTNEAVVTHSETAEVQDASNLPEQEKPEQPASSAAALTKTAPEEVASHSPSHEEAELQHGALQAELHTAQQEQEQQSDHPKPLHTVKVNYQDNEICLFPPTEEDESEMFFLADVTLAHQSLDKLLSACRDVLRGAIEDDEELVLDVASLGLHISEDSSYAAQITMSQILEVYLTLCHNAPGEHPEPLHCGLSSRVSLAAQHAYLLSAAQQGKTFAEIAAEHIHSLEESSEEIEETADPATGFPEGAEISQHGDPDQKVQEHTEVERNQNELDHPDPDPPQDLLYQEEQEELNTALDVEDGNHAESAPEAGFDANDAIVEHADHGENETSATSTVRGDEPEHQDLGEVTRGYDESSRHGPSGSSNIDASDDKVGASSAHEDTESSHTVEAADESHDQTLLNDEEDEDYNEDPEDPHNDDIDNFGNSAEERNDPTGSATEVQESDYLDLEGEGDSHELTGRGEPDVQSGDALKDEAYAQQEDLFDESLSNGASIHERSHEKELLAGLDTEVKVSVTEVTPPATPSGKSSKRKAIEDDDAIDFLEYDTPDAKRRRPS